MVELLSPKREAIRLTQVWRAVHGLTFPIDAGALAQEWSRSVSPEAPIGELLEQELDGFEGGLFWLKQRKIWALLYHPQPQAPGRANFTVAHEFGHYVLHRNIQATFQCSQSATLGLAGARIEREADQFASYLLMPIDDFSAQISGQHITLDVLGECAVRYGVSLTAAVLKWLEFTDQPAVAVVGREGMLHWWRGSDSAKRYAYGLLAPGMELPKESLAVRRDQGILPRDLREGIEHAAGVWPFVCPVREMVVISDRYDMSISLLVLEREALSHAEAWETDMMDMPPRF